MTETSAQVFTEPFEQDSKTEPDNHTTSAILKILISLFHKYVIFVNAPQLHHSLFPGSKNEETLQGVREKIRMNTTTAIPSCALVGLKIVMFIMLYFYIPIKK